MRSPVCFQMTGCWLVVLGSIVGSRMLSAPCPDCRCVLNVAADLQREGCSRTVPIIQEGRTWLATGTECYHWHVKVLRNSFKSFKIESQFSQNGKALRFFFAPTETRFSYKRHCFLTCDIYPHLRAPTSSNSLVEQL